MHIYEPPKKPIALKKDRIYLATLIWRRPDYSQVVLKDYYISPLKTHCYFYDDAALTKFQGCFPMHWFDNFKEVNPIIIEETCSNEMSETELESGYIASPEEELIKTYQQLTLF